MTWGFYGRSRERQQLVDILRRKRWFFARVTGRRRIGKTTLVQQALASVDARLVFYVQVPDSAPAGVLSAVRDSMETFELDAKYTRPDSLLELARLIERLVEDGFVVALDEFQYFSRAHLSEFTSHLQASVDTLSAKADQVPGGLIVLGSLHAELVALLEDRDAPLYNRVTDQLELEHLDVASILEMLRTHADTDPNRLLFLWNLFEGVPKFYRDAYEQGVLGKDRKDVIAGMFFRSSSPLRTEADNWFLSELRGRYDVVLKYVARNPGASHADIEAYVRDVSPQTAEQVGGYLRILDQKYRMIERRLPVMSKPTARRGRYYLRDNFLRSWLHALQTPVASINFRPESLLVEQSDTKLKEAEGHAMERLAAQLYEERSRKGLGDFPLSHRIEGYWDRNDTEIDLVALDEEDERVRFGSCKRNGERLVGSIAGLREHAERFASAHPRLRDWKRELVAIAPEISPEDRTTLEAEGILPQSLDDLTRDLA
jgi:AAA+ ATPase superfamily predicted ATPase